ncbi:hypothetical protein [Roseovarius atlanticus]|uniref:hypothetical protein n=1 Tax=Roseovarius atlanticus TaxID=1641875 RepID=UPI001C93EF1E|nr:hypothetical protein [Roseovarius atlanticus]MBY5989424.1 hypothetical protein [Roseovarius atlanticus]MBY6124816.1 hypothetical protein [Roseovarius atlanticus]MBY6149311.1 hypothetical protein [Roseovarius atlanticus]
MPEDGIIIDFRSIPDAKTRSLAEDLAEDIVQRSIMEYFEPKARDTATAQDIAEPEWDSLVPPDMTDSFDFLL